MVPLELQFLYDNKKFFLGSSIESVNDLLWNFLIPICLALYISYKKPCLNLSCLLELAGKSFNFAL